MGVLEVIRGRGEGMKIITVNIPEKHLADIERLVGEGSLYPSRSELIRVAVREHLKKILREIKDQTQIDIEKSEEEQVASISDKDYACVPIETTDENGNKVHGFKTYKILKRLEF